VHLAIGFTVVLPILRLVEHGVANVAREMLGMPHLVKGQDRATLAGFTAPRTLLEQQDIVVRLAIEVALELVAIAALELNAALLTAIMARVDKLTLNEEIRTNDGLVATSAEVGLRPNDVLVGTSTSRAVNLVNSIDLVLLLNEIRATSRAEEMLGVEG